MCCPSLQTQRTFKQRFTQTTQDIWTTRHVAARPALSSSTHSSVFDLFRFIVIRMFLKTISRWRGRFWGVMMANVGFGAHHFWKMERKWKRNETILLLKCIFFLKTAVIQSVGFACSLYGFGCVAPWPPRMLSWETNVELSACRNDGGASGSHGCRRPNLREQRQGGVQHHPRTALLLGGAQDG